MPVLAQMDPIIAALSNCDERLETGAAVTEDIAVGNLVNIPIKSVQQALVPRSPRKAWAVLGSAVRADSAEVACLPFLHYL
mmetsp:Transcript_8016/g.23819  ORF Transcript_8016/g.23819 Transcript_8016/m.23819 type:complete len:81 (-) Transcript_8016:1115-1357(-)